MLQSAERALVPKLINEAVRFEPVATFKVRETSKEVQFHGVTIPKGSFIQCLVASANRDEEVFEHPDVFDIDRRVKPSFGFGFGPHMCIGQFVAPGPGSTRALIEGAQLGGAAHVHMLWD